MKPRQRLWRDLLAVGAVLLFPSTAIAQDGAIVSRDTV
jgi:hypothetical protein